MRQRPSKQIVPRPAGQSAHRSASRTPVGYPALLEDIKSRIRTAQIKASLSVNRELIQLYWSIGRDIAVKQEYQGWGAKVIDRLAADLQREFPGLSGFRVATSTGCEPSTSRTDPVGNFSRSLRDN